MIARLKFFEQADILNRDDRLIGEGLQKGDLLVGERVHLDAADYESPDCGSLPH